METLSQLIGLAVKVALFHHFVSASHYTKNPPLVSEGIPRHLCSRTSGTMQGMVYWCCSISHTEVSKNSQCKQC